jgi:hypothetical protein
MVFPPRPNSFYSKILFGGFKCPPNISESRFLKLRKKAIAAGILDKLELPSRSSVKMMAAQIKGEVMARKENKDHRDKIKLIHPPEKVVKRYNSWMSFLLESNKLRNNWQGCQNSWKRIAKIGRRECINNPKNKALP